MDTKFKIRILELLDILKGKFYFLKPIIRPFYVKFIASKQVKMRNSVFLNNAVGVLATFDKAMKDADIEYTLAFGSLLGAIREGGFIKHDLDIDTAIWYSDYSSLIKTTLEKYGFKLKHSFVVDEGNSAREDTYILNGVSIDIFYIYPPIDNFPYCCDFINHEGEETFAESLKQFNDKITARRIQLPLKRGTKLVKFEKLELPIPINGEEILEFRYGPDWKTPNPHWSMTRSYNKYVTNWIEKKVRVDLYS